MGNWLGPVAPRVVVVRCPSKFSRKFTENWEKRMRRESYPCELSRSMEIKQQVEPILRLLPLKTNTEEGEDVAGRGC